MKVIIIIDGTNRIGDAASIVEEGIKMEMGGQISEGMSKPTAGVTGKASTSVCIGDREQGNKSKCESPLTLKTSTANGVNEENLE